MATIITKNSSTASSVPLNTQLVQGELAVNVTDKRLFTENASGTVVELGTNPSSLTLPNGTANGLAFLNASKVLTTGSALTFDGTTLAAKYADVFSNVLSEETQLRVGYSSSFNWSFGRENATTGDLIIKAVTSGTSSSPLLRLTTSGNLGLGVTPSAWGTSKALQISRFSLNVDSSGRYNNLATNAYNDGSWKYIASSVPVTMLGLDNANGSFAFLTAPSGTAGAAISFTQAMTLDSSGNLLVGVASAAGSLNGVQVNGSNRSIMSYTSGGSGAGACFHARRDSNGNAVQFVYGGWDSFVGSISVTSSATAYNTSSDYRLKENIQPMTGALAKVAALKPCTYKWKADGSDGEGFIAHELAEVVPQCVTGEKDAVDAEGNPVYQGIDTSFLVATLTAAIQELKASLDEVKLEFDAYKAAHP